MKKKQIINDIQYDIEKGYFDHFEVLKNRLIFICKKLSISIYTVNSDKLSFSEKKTLFENGYLSDINELI